MSADCEMEQSLMSNWLDIKSAGVRLDKKSLTHHKHPGISSCFFAKTNKGSVSDRHPVCHCWCLGTIATIQRKHLLLPQQKLFNSWLVLPTELVSQLWVRYLASKPLPTPGMQKLYSSPLDIKIPKIPSTVHRQGGEQRTALTTPTGPAGFSHTLSVLHTWFQGTEEAEWHFISQNKDCKGC